MSNAETISLRGGLSVVAEELARLRVKDFTPVMQQIQAKYMEPAAAVSWAGSGLHSRSGELHKGVVTFAGKVSAGVGIRTVKGRDLVLPKAVAHTFGVTKQKKWTRKYARVNKRRNFNTWVIMHGKSPWGDIPAREFTPSSLPPSASAEVQTMIVEYINDRLGRTR